MKHQTINGLQPIIQELVQQNKSNAEFMDILSSLWDVYHKPSSGEDLRYQDLGGEIEKHFVVNDDWSFSKLFVSFLHYDQIDETYYQFLEALLNMAANPSSEIVKSIENTLKTEGLYLIQDKNGTFSISRNRNEKKSNYTSPYPIYVCEAVSWKDWGVVQQNVKWPDKNNCLVLAFNEGWDDYDSKTWYVLYYVDAYNMHTRIGDVKIMHEDDGFTPNKLPLEFNSLDGSFCSVGQDVSYYKVIRDYFGDDAYKILFALRDCAINTKNLQKFEKHTYFINSLIRDNNAERALRLGRFKLQNRDIEDAFSYDYIFRQKYDGIGDISATIPFHFKYNCLPFKRAIALIGENGVGKTTLIKDMIDALLQQKSDRFEKTIPVVSQLLLVSYSPFDRYLTTNDNGEIGYQYRGLLAEDGHLYTPDEQIERLLADVKEILRRTGTRKGVLMWEKYMAPIFDKDGPMHLFEENEMAEYEVNEEAFKTWYQHLSSGEALFANTISAILAYIRFDSFVILDEPEQHLHPRAISVLIRTILLIAVDFESYVIIATHSPMVIREITSDNVIIMSREGAHLSVAKIGIESFGADVSILTDVVFRDSQDVKQYEITIQNLIRMGTLNYAQIVECIQNDHNKLSLNMRLLIRDIIDKELRTQHETSEL